MQSSAPQGRLAGAHVDMVADALKLHRILWQLSFAPQPKPAYTTGPIRTIPAAQFDDCIRKAHSDTLPELVQRFEADDVCRRRDGEFRFHLDLLHPVKCARYAVGHDLSEHDLRYLVLRDIRFRYDRHLASSTARLLHQLARAANDLAAADVMQGITSRHRSPPRRFVYHQTFIPALEAALDTLTPASQQAISFFVEVCAAVEYIKPNVDGVSISFRTMSVDAEYLLSNLFGLTTGIPGFDDMFGGGGVILAEAFGAPPQKDLEESQSIWGRTLLIEGESGTGKSMLSLQIAMEVARKGGLVWIESLEQPAEECLYALEVIQAIPQDGSVVVATRTAQAVRLLESRRPGVGGIIILRGEKSSFEDMLEKLSGHAAKMKEYPIRLIIVDPINSVIREGSDPTKLRAAMLGTIEKIKRWRTNLCLIAEESSVFADDLMFEKNIADIVLHLSVEERHNYAQRYIAVHKCRLQREQRGEHPFVIVPGRGIAIYPSPAAVTTKIRSRSIQPPDRHVEFGMSDVDRMLGPRALAAGDVIVLQGPGGTYKTPFGISFLLGRDAEPGTDTAYKAGSLWVMVRDSVATAKRLLSSGLVRPRAGQKQASDIRLCPLPAGHVQPGYILQRIEDEIVAARRANVRIDRVMIDDVAHWELSSPFVRDDDTFADTLVELLQRQGLTALYTCSPIAAQEWSVLQRSIVDRADCVIEFDRAEFLGAQRVRVRVQNTRGMRHRRDAYEVTLREGRLELEATPSLIRVDGSGSVSGVPIRLLLHSETHAQVEYQLGLRDALRAALSKSVDVEPQSVYMQKALSLSRLSVIDEAQLLQLDEFELSGMMGEGHESLPFRRFPTDVWEENWDDILADLKSRVRWPDGAFFAVPFYGNLSVLAHDADVLSTHDWRELALECLAWERDNPSADNVFFDFPRGSDEDFNCLFFEILASICPIPEGRGVCHLRHWLDTTAAVEAALILRQLCRRVYLLDPVGAQRNPRSGHKIVSFRKAKVWRLWYSMLTELKRCLGSGDQENMRISVLPGGISIAGEWYLAVPAYSAAPDVTLEILRMLTTRDAELERLRMGVGLPIRAPYYDEQIGSVSAKHADMLFALPRHVVSGLFTSAIRRSRFGCYRQLSGELAHQIRQIIEIPNRPEDQLRERVALSLSAFQESIRLVGISPTCSSCRSK